MTLPLRPAAVLALALLVSATPAEASQAIKCTANDVRLSRTFAPPAPRAAAVGGAAFELTRADFVDLYAFGLEIEIGLSPDDESYPFDVGFTDDPARKSFVAPEVDFDVITWTLVDPATTPYAATYPAATHALVTDTDPDFDGTRYQFFTFAEQQLVFDAYLDVPADGSGALAEDYAATLALFPLNTETSVQNAGFFYYDEEFAEEGIDPDLAFPSAMNAGYHGLGSLVRPDGTTVEVGSYYEDLDIYDADGSGELFDFETLYSIYGVDGTWLAFRVAPPPGSRPGDEIAIQGEVWIDAVEYWQVNRSSVANGAGPDAETPWSLFPNPTTDRVRFSEPLTATVYDMMGRAVREAREAREMDLRGLAAGTYVVRSEAGRSRTVTVRR